MIERGQFITIEGQDGAGKSTNIEVIHDYLYRQGRECIRTREPGGTAFGENVRELLLSDGDKAVGDMAELLMMFAARAQHIKQVIEPALSQGNWVLCDRFTDATYAYQGGGRGLKLAAIESLEQLVQGDLRPNLTILLDLPVEVGEARAGQRSAPDRFEQQQIKFKQRVRDYYLKRAAAEPKRTKVVNANQPLAAVKAEILEQLQLFCQQNG